jgi:hypothetical protein
MSNIERLNFIRINLKLGKNPNIDIKNQIDFSST